MKSILLTQKVAEKDVTVLKNRILKEGRQLQKLENAQQEIKQSTNK